MTESIKTVIRPDTSEYTTVRAAGGGKSQICGDAVSRALVGMTVGDVKSVAKAFGFGDVDKYDHLNAGQIRMNLGNRIRGAVSKMEAIYVVEEDEETGEEKVVEDGEGTGYAFLDKVAAPIRLYLAEEAEAAAVKKAEEKAAAKAEKAAKDAAAKKIAAAKAAEAKAA